jgi:hypothetical protein
LINTYRLDSVPINKKAGKSLVNNERERLLLEKVVVHRSAFERSRGSVLTNRSKSLAVNALRQHGLCIIPGYFSKELIVEGGKCAVKDVKDAIIRLEAPPISMKLTPSPPVNVDYDEYSKRDEQFVRGHGDKYTLKRGARMEIYAAKHEEEIRHNASLLEVLEEIVLPSSKTKDEHEERKSQTMLRRSSSLLESHELGAVVAMPGRSQTKDQNIHVDTEHLYEHVHLPPHYIVMFLPSLSTDLELAENVGQTAFVVGSHVSQSAKAVAKDGKMEAHRVRWSLESVVRPHCSSGDAVLFDARILHFGIANSSNDVWRPLLFINYTRPWFSDYQPGGEIIVRHR